MQLKVDCYFVNIDFHVNLNRSLKWQTFEQSNDMKIALSWHQPQLWTKNSVYELFRWFSCEMQKSKTFETVRNHSEVSTKLKYIYRTRYAPAFSCVSVAEVGLEYNREKHAIIESSSAIFQIPIAEWKKWLKSSEKAYCMKYMSVSHIHEAR